MVVAYSDRYCFSRSYSDATGTDSAVNLADNTVTSVFSIYLSHNGGSRSPAYRVLTPHADGWVSMKQLFVIMKIHFTFIGVGFAFGLAL